MNSTLAQTRSPMPKSFGWSALVTCSLGLVAITILATPDLARALLQKEGLVEQLSHLVLLAGVVLWSRRAREGGAHRVFAALAAVYTATLLAEEIDWGKIYGLPVLRTLGFDNLHNIWHGNTYLLFGVPLLLCFLAPAMGRPRKLLDAMGSYTPSEDARIALLIVLIANVPVSLTPWSSYFQELTELLMFAVMLAPTLRCVPGPTRPAIHQG